MSKSSRTPRHDLAVILGLLTVLLFASPLTDWWAKMVLPWYAPYALWALVVLLGALLARRNRHDEP